MDLHISLSVSREKVASRMFSSRQQPKASRREDFSGLSCPAEELSGNFCLSPADMQKAKQLRRRSARNGRHKYFD